MILKKIFSAAASIIKFFIFLFLLSNSNAEENNFKYFSKDLGTLSLMYHRFNEEKYPSTNIDMEVFQNQINLIIKDNLSFNNPDKFSKNFSKPKSEKEILITIDDAFTSFYDHAWPYLKKNKIPFILFVSTEHVGKFGYMTWDQILEVEKEEFAFIGNHSHSHEYLVKFSFEDFKKDINKSIQIFESKLGYNPIFFSYPFGEYSLDQKNYLKEKFSFAFGQHSGIIDINKDKFELPRFPINEKYGDLKRFNFLIKMLPLQYKIISPEEKFILENENPPQIIIEFFQEQLNLELINCFSNEGGNWKNTNIQLNGKKLFINLKEKFTSRRGRINCSLNDKLGWRWLGLQFTIKKN